MILNGWFEVIDDNDNVSPAPSDDVYDCYACRDSDAGCWKHKHLF